MRPEYDFSKGVRGKHFQAYRAGTNVVFLEPDVAEMFPDSASVNHALRLLGRLARTKGVADGRANKALQPTSRAKGRVKSRPSIIAMASVVGASVMTGDAGYANGTGFEILAGILAFIAVGSVIGVFNGMCTTRFNMPPFIVTLTTMMFFSGAAIWYTTVHTDASSIGNLPRAFIEIGQGRVAGLPVSLAVVLIVAGVGHFILSRTVYGRWLYAVGLNPKAAAVSGVPVRRVIFWAFVISGVCAAISSVLYTGRLETGTPVLGQRILLDVVGAAVIGGVSLFGGKGKIVWTVFGVLFLTVIDKSLQLMGLPIASVFAIKGSIILAAAIIDAQRHRLLVRG